MVMRFKAVPFTHLEYEALRKRSEPLSVVWGMGHVFFVVFLSMAFAIPFAGRGQSRKIPPETKETNAKRVKIKAGVTHNLSH
jgi:hypothetical protein